MNTLETLMRPAAAMMNRQISAKTPAREICAELEGRSFALRVRGTAIALYITVDEGRVVMTGDYIEEPDVVATGSLISLARLAGPAGEKLVRDGAIDMAGDAIVASRFRKLLRYGEPDLEEELSRLVGDAAAHSIGEFVRGVASWTHSTGAIMQQNIGEYLQEESRAVPARHEALAFRESVDTLRDDVARFEARLRKFEQGRG